MDADKLKEFFCAYDNTMKEGGCNHAIAPNHALTCHATPMWGYSFPCNCGSEKLEQLYNEIKQSISKEIQNEQAD